MILILLALAGCNRPQGEDTGPTIETGWFSDTGDLTAEGCPHRFTRTEPEAGESAWYWRDGPRLYTQTPRTESYGARLVDAHDRVVAVDAQWSESGQILDLVLQEPLAASTDYALELHDCTGPQTLSFSTSALGGPLEGGPSSLMGKTWLFDLTEGDWIQPEGFGAVLNLYFTTPILIGVEWADESMVDLVGAQGRVTELGDVIQVSGEPSWDFPVADFTAQPWMTATSGQVDILFQGVPVTIYDFSLQGTFAPDGSSFGGGVVSGLGDTRNMGVFIDKPDDPGAICDLATSMNTQCIACPDGYRYCLELVAEEMEGELVEGLTLVK